MSAVRGWQLTIDWSGGGGLTGPLEDVTNYVNRSTVTASWGRPVDTVDLDTPASEMDFQLINRTRLWDRWFSPENPSSPIAGKIYPGKQVALSRTVRTGAVLASESWSVLGTAGWAAVGGGAIIRVVTPSEDGTGSLQYVPPGAVATVGVTGSTKVGFMLEPAGGIVVSMRVLTSVSYTDIAAVADWYDQSGTLIGTSAVNTSPTTGSVWTTVTSGPLVPPTAAVSMLPRLRIGSTPAGTLQVNIDNMSVSSAPNDAGRTYTPFAGVLDDFGVDSQSAARTFTGKALDAWNGPTGGNLSTILYTGIRTGAAIGVVLDAAGWTGPRALDPGATVIPWWWEEGSDPAAAIENLVNSEGSPAIFYIEGGTAVFRDRHHRVRSTASNTTQALFSLIVPAGTGPGYDFKIEKDSFEYDHGLKSIYNSATFSVDQRKPTDIIELWSSEDPISMTAGETRTIFAQSSDPAFNVITPDTTTDILISGGSFTATVDRTSGAKFIVVVTCTGTGTINRIALRGNALPVVRTVQAQATDAGSIARYKEAKWPGELPWASQYDAQAIADRTVAIYADNRPRVSFTLVAFNDRYVSEMLSMRISDRITIRNDVLGVNGDFQVERLEISVERWQIFRLKVSCVKADPLQPSNLLTFGVAGKGFDQGFFGATGIDNAATMFVFDQAGQGFDQGVFAT